MRTRNIAPEEWTDFFDSFSRQHAGWLVTVEVIGTEVGAQIEARDVPLGGVSAAPDESTVWLALGRQPADHVTHRVDHVRGVRLQQTDDGADQALQIESDGDVMTLVRFRTAVRSEQVDGIAP